MSSDKLKENLNFIIAASCESHIKDIGKASLLLLDSLPDYSLASSVGKDDEDEYDPDTYIDLELRDGINNIEDEINNLDTGIENYEDENLDDFTNNDLKGNIAELEQFLEDLEQKESDLEDLIEKTKNTIDTYQEELDDR